MPEGDTIFRAARALHRALAGHTVLGFETGLAQLANVDRDEPVAGTRIVQVESRGKHLLIWFSDGRILRTHMRMNGSWHLYRPGEPWRRGRHRARITLRTDAFVAVGFDVPVAEFLRGEELDRHEPLRRLGPDLATNAFDAEEALARLKARPELTLADALLNQTLLAGAGNVFKSEILFAARVHPFTQVGAVSEQTLREIIDIARKFLAANVRAQAPGAIITYTGFRRTTGRADPAERLWVYGRMHEPCRVCATPIAMERRGLQARSTYYCRRCQPLTSGRTANAGPTFHGAIGDDR